MANPLRAGDEIHVTIPSGSGRRQPGVRIHRRATLTAADTNVRAGIPATAPARTLLDLAPSLAPHQLEAAVNEADKRDLISPEPLRSLLAGFRGQPGVAALREVLDRRTFRLTDSELERRFLRLVRAAKLPMPDTGTYLHGLRVDFFWPDLGLVVETDGLRYHRTPAQQARDRRRDQVHLRAGLTTLRFTHGQIRFEPASVVETLAAVVARLRRDRRPVSPT